MGNSIGGGRKRAKVMKVNGEVFKLKTPIRALEVVKDYPGHVLMDSEAVKHFGIRAQPMESQQELRPKKVYFLVELPKFPEHEKAPPRRVRSGINMTAKDRLECLMLSRRSVSDLAAARPSSGPMMLSDRGQQQQGREPMQVKLRIPRAQLAKLVEESEDGVDVADKILDLYMMNSSPQEPQVKPSLIGNKINVDSFRGHQVYHQYYYVNSLGEAPTNLG
ncbi:uncharacterized protein At1g66480-like isoform X2 [Punica granatum]|uniref:Uncharacterized protein At1g66480-like isoform X2 n=1 Tax=Punica granatum TaxID=22663 RepID=A0A6P8DGV1_PUNGR|nr:uncharacterized protein At1g66480-like isoform X2 [Punica granatum]